MITATEICMICTMIEDVIRNEENGSWVYDSYKRSISCSS